MTYQVIATDLHGYESMQYETGDLDQALEVKHELEAESYMNGERDICYYIKEVGE